MTLYQLDLVAMDDLDRDAKYRMMERRVLVPVEMGHVFTVGDPWDNEVWLPSLFPKGTRVAVIRIGDDE